jgi:hypothetical protein
MVISKIPIADAIFKTSKKSTKKDGRGTMSRTTMTIRLKAITMSLERNNFDSELKNTCEELFAVAIDHFPIHSTALNAL